MYVVQHTEITMVNAQFSKFVASLETREGCPITPGAAFTKQFYLVPLASSNKDRRGIALDGHLKVCYFYTNIYIYILIILLSRRMNNKILTLIKYFFFFRTMTLI